MRKEIEAMKEAAQKGGERILELFNQSLDIEQKSTVADFRTQADTNSENEILAILKSAFPEYSIIAEEDGETQSESEYTFVIDPLDGTNNFSLGIPYFVVSIGLLHKGRSIAGVIYNPVSKQMYVGDVDAGIVTNGSVICVGSETDIKRMTVSYCQGYTTPLDAYTKFVGRCADANLKRLLNSWSPAHDLALLASGKIEGQIASGGEIYDYAAGFALVKAAGGVIVDWEGSEIEIVPRNGKWIAANCMETAQQICSLWQECL